MAYSPLDIYSAFLGVMNLYENLSQSDKDDMMQRMDEEFSGMLEQFEKDLDEQNEMLKEIIELLQQVLIKLGDER